MISKTRIGTIGSGVLGLPFVLREQGMVVGLAFIAFGALLSSISQVHLQKGKMTSAVIMLMML